MSDIDPSLSSPPGLDCRGVGVHTETAEVPPGTSTGTEDVPAAAIPRSPIWIGDFGWVDFTWMLVCGKSFRKRMDHWVIISSQVIPQPHL